MFLPVGDVPTSGDAVSELVERGVSPPVPVSPDIVTDKDDDERGEVNDNELENSNIGDEDTQTEAKGKKILSSVSLVYFCLIFEAVHMYIFIICPVH